MKGRAGALWLRDVAELPVDEMIEEIAGKGFKGIYIDRYGFEDNGASIEKQIEDVLKTKPIVSENDRLVFFKIPSHSS